MIVDGQPASEVVVRGKRFDVRTLLIDDLRSVKRKDSDKEGKKRINSKEEQKNILGGRSPDMGDTFMMREWFEICRKPQPGFTVL